MSMVSNIMSNQNFWIVIQYYGNDEYCDACCIGVFSKKSSAIARAVVLAMKGYEDINGLDEELENLFTNDSDRYHITWQLIKQYIDYLGVFHISDYVNYKIEKCPLIQ